MRFKTQNLVFLECRQSPASEKISSTTKLITARVPHIVPYIKLNMSKMISRFRSKYCFLKTAPLRLIILGLDIDASLRYDLKKCL